MEDFISYAQFEEDLIIYNLLKNEIEDNEKHYVDIGANDPMGFGYKKFLPKRLEWY